MQEALQAGAISYLLKNVSVDDLAAAIAAAYAGRATLAPEAVQAHVSNVLSKLEVSNRAEAVVYAVQKKLV